MHELLLDTSSLMYRAFHALPTSIRDGEGRAVNAVHGYLDMTSRLRHDRRPDRVWHVLDDDWRPAERVAAYGGYKSTRAEDPPELPWQFTLLLEVLRAAGACIAWSPGWEADDAIGVMAARAVTAADGGDPPRLEIVTGDRDLLQLVRDPVVRVLFTRRGVSQIDEYDEAAVHDAYGVPPSRYVDYAVLRGDPSDGLPGLRGVGEKTARRLVQAYPDLEAMVADAGAQPPRLAGVLKDGGTYLRAMRQVVPIRTDVPLEQREHEPDDVRLDALAAAHRLDNAVGRLRAARQGGAG